MPFSWRSDVACVSAVHARSFAEKTLATLRQHDDMAHQLANAKGNK